MERDSPDILHTVVLMRLTDETSKEAVAGALSRLSGLPVDRISRRLETLPWMMMERASRAKASRLVKILRDLNVEVEIIPPLPESESPQTLESSGGPSAPAQAKNPASSEDGQTRTTSVGVGPFSASVHVGPPIVEKGLSWNRTIDQSAPDVADTARSTDGAMEPLSLEGVLDPAFRLERSDSWLRAVILVPWNILAGTLQALAPTLDRSFDICRGHFWRLFAIIGIPWMIVAGIVLIGAVIVGIAGLTLQSLLQLPVWLMVIGTVVAIPGVLVGGALFLFWPQAALIHAISEIYLGREISVEAAYRYAWAKIVRFVLTSYLMMLITFGAFFASCLAAGLALVAVVVGLLVLDATKSPIGIVVAGVITAMAFVLPLAYIVPRLLFYDKALIIEDIAYGDAFRRSWRLMSGRAGESWYTSYYWLFGMLLLVLIFLQWGIMILFEGPSLVLTHLLPVPKTFGMYAGQVLSTFGNLLAQVYGVAVNVLFYYGIRSRKEGHDFMALMHADEEEPMA